MGFLSDLGLDSVDADPNSFPDAKYAAFVYDAKMISYKDSSKGQALVLTYKIADGLQKGKTIDEWKTANPFDDAQKKAWLKQRILSIGIPESKLNDVDPDDLIGTPIYFTKKQKGEYHNVTFVEPRAEGDSLSVTESPANAGVAASTTDISDLL